MLLSKRQCGVEPSGQTLLKTSPKEPSKSLISGGSNTRREILDVRSGFRSLCDHKMKNAAV